MLVLKNGAELERKMLAYYRMCMNLKKEDKTSYNVYWKPIQDALDSLNPKGFSKIYFSPDGVYNQVNLTTLKNPETGKYLLETNNIHLLGSSRDLIEFGEDKPIPVSTLKKQKAYLFGSPSYGLEETGDTDGTRSANLSYLQEAIGSNVTWAALPATKVEVENINKMLTSKRIADSVFVGEKASEEQVKALRSPAILHIATHGYFVKEYSGKIETTKDYMIKEALKDPFQRCGLAFAGCSDPKPNAEDGILTAAEAMNLHLDETELVVLSACETGLGDIVNGEGVYGLQRAFQQAGAKTIVMSLWKVSDEATQLLMDSFYKYLLKGKPKREAFALAQKELRKQFPHPYYWGAFVVVGE
jgi:CHAT domain-containing protein